MMRYRMGTFSVMVAALAAGCQASDGTISSVSESLTSAQNSALASARAATAKFHDVTAAEAAGYQLSSPCVVGPPGAGAMGFHYINFALLGPPPSATHPQAVLYAPADNGALKLIAVEYIQPVFQDGAPYFGATPPDHAAPPPSLFGQAFLGPEEPHGPGAPWTYELHVWLWKHNPSGMFNEWNPTVVCTEGGVPE